MWPFLTSNCPNAYEGKQLCEIADVTIRQAFQNLMATVKVSELPSLMETVKVMPEDRIERKLIELFQDETVAAASIMIGGMTQVIEKELQLKAKELKLKDLPAKFLD